MLKQKFRFEWEITIEKANKIYKQFPFSKRVAVDYINVLINLSTKQELLELSNTAEQARCIHDEYNILDTAIAYIMILKKLSWKQDNVIERKQTEEIARSIFESYQHERIASNYISILSRRLFKQEDNTLWINRVDVDNHELINIEEKVKVIYKKYISSLIVSTQYIYFLSILSWKKENEFEIEKLVKEARNVYQQYSEDFEVASAHIITLSRLTWIRKDKKIRKKLIDEAKKIFKKHQNSEKVSIEYIKMLYKLALKQGDEHDLLHTVNNAKLVYEKHQHNDNVITLYLKILLVLSWKQSGEERQRATDLDIINILKFNTKLLYIFDEHIDTMVNLNNRKKFSYRLKYCVNLFKHFAEQNEQRNILVKSKYGIITKDNELILDHEVEKLLKIFSLVQSIKNQLVVKNPGGLTFGHYTSGKVLQLFLKQGKEESRGKNKYLSRTKSRLNNVNYMNDPSEGKVLDQLLNLDTVNQKLTLKPSPWFLMSLTTAVDQLTMWSQYGNQAKGVCVVLASDDFSAVDFASNADWLTIANNITHSNDDEVEGITQKNKGSKDFIYRIGYLSKQDNKEVSLNKEHNAHLDVGEISKLLKVLKETMIDIDKESSLYEKVNECLEEIRYLFKSADYSYESELRVLKYMPLEPDNPKIKIDDSGDFAKLYIERDNPIQISEVIFGPKFQNPENVTPLLRLLDKNIKFRQSEISFR